MDVQSNLPLTEVTFFILLSLASKSKHGYAIMKDVEDMSAGRLGLSTGTLYGALKRLLDQEWITRIEDPQPNGTERERKAYRLTRLGRRILEAEVVRLDSLVATAHLHVAGENA